MTCSDYQARYASDVNGVVALYNTLLRGVVVNILLIITNFVFLCLNEWRIATITLGFLAMGVTSGPTELAGEAAAEVQKLSTKGMALIGSCKDNAEEVKDRHEVEVMIPINRSLWRQTFMVNSVDTYINMFASFLTVIVVITMSYQVFYGEMDSSEFLGTFFIFKQLQKPAMKISSVIKSAVKRSANLERVNDIVFSGPSPSIVAKERGHND